MVEQVMELLDAGQPTAAIDAIQANGSPAEVGKRYEQLVLDIYWKKKNLSAVVRIAQAGLDYCLRRSRETPDEHAAALRDSAKKMAYNFASFCWPGWDEPGIAIDQDQVRIGAETAKLNLQLARELKRPPKGMSMAHWMLGGYALALKNYSEAADEFTTAISFDQQAADRESELFNEANRALSRIGQGNSAAESDWARLLENLEAMNTDDSKEYLRQLRMVRNAFAL